MTREQTMTAIGEEPDREARELPDDDSPHRPGSWPARAGAEFHTLEHFYDTAPDAVRRQSPESDFGVLWTEPDLPFPTYPRYRVSWVERSGELYALELDGDERLEVLGVTYAPDEALQGWEYECEKPGSLEWVRERISRIQVQR